jgi:hypothetical protein
MNRESEIEHAPSPESTEDIERTWLELPEAEREAYRTKAGAYMAEAFRTANPSGDTKNEKEVWERRNNLVVHGGVGDVELTKHDYDTGSELVDGLKKKKKGDDFFDEFERWSANLNLDVMAMRMMQRDRKSV